MYEVNTMDGSKAKTVVAEFTAKAEFKVGGESDEDRIDSVRTMFDDHYDDIVKNSFFGDAISSLVLDSVTIKGDDEDEDIPAKMTGNMCQWLSDLLDPAISDARIGAENEHIWANGAETPEAAAMHENNAEELKQYAEILECLKKRCVS